MAVPCTPHEHSHTSDRILYNRLSLVDASRLGNGRDKKKRPQKVVQSKAVDCIGKSHGVRKMVCWEHEHEGECNLIVVVILAVHPKRNVRSPRTSGPTTDLILNCFIAHAVKVCWLGADKREHVCCDDGVDDDNGQDSPIGRQQEADVPRPVSFEIAVEV